jgi:hypothetical protein
MRRRGVRAPLGLLLIAALLVAAPAPAEDPVSRSSSAPAPLDSEGRLSIAKDLFRRGVALLNAGDFEGALDFFLRSRAFVPSSPNTKNTAICLERLGRYDEALSMYEELLRSFGTELSAAEQATLGQVIRTLGQKVGSIQITANVDGQVLIDGKDRGRLPLVGPVRVLPPRHAIRITKDGYVPFEVVVDIEPGALATVNARLRLLTFVGLLRVEDSGSDGADVFVDGRRVGTAPWEGVVEPGKHLVWTRRGSRGSAPVAIVAIQGQTALARIASSALGPPVQIEASPSTAQIAIDGIALGSRSWEGRLPVGLHQVAIAEDGYVNESRSLMVPPSGIAEPSASLKLNFALALDPGHPRWNRRAEGPAFLKGRSFLGVFGGYAGSASLHESGALGCPKDCSAKPKAHGFLVGLRSGYRLGIGLSPELAGGYMSFGSTLSSLRGLFVGAGVSYRVAPVAFLGFLLRTTVGLLAAETGDEVGVVPAQPFFVMPEIGAETVFGGLHVGMQLGLGFFPSDGPKLDRSDAAGGSVRPYGSFVLWAPQVGAYYSFE